MTTERSTEIKQALLEKIRGLDSFVVTSHINPDGDAIGSSLAMAGYLRSIGKRVTVMLESIVPEVYRFLDRSDGIVLAELVETPVEADCLIALECPSVSRMGEVRDKTVAEATVLCIDHHLDSVEYGQVNWIDISYSSVGEMLWDLFGLAGYTPDQAGAEQLYTAVMTDTGRFRFDNTTARTMRCAADLIAWGAKPDKISREVYFTTRPSTLRLRGLVLNEIRFEADERICMLRLTNEMLNTSGADPTEAEGLIDVTLFGKGVELGAMFKEKDETLTRVSLRSANKINVARIAKEFGGGGHFHAAGFDFPGSIDKAEQVIAERLSEALDGH